MKLYLEIEKMRFEDRLRPHFRVEPETIGARLPSLLLQPLIENAIKYAVTPSEDGADIWITAMREGQAVRIEVADNGDGGGAGTERQPVHRCRTGEHSGQTVAGLWRSAPFRDQDERSKGASALSSTSPTKPETRPDDHPDHFGRRRTPGDTGPAA